MASKTSKLMMEAAKKKQYLDYYKMMRKSGEQPMTQFHWKESGTEPVYFKGVTKTRAEAKMPRLMRKRMGMKD